MLMEPLQTVFASRLIDDDRSPVVEMVIGDFHLGLVAPHGVFFLQIIVLLLIEMAIANVLAVLVYYGIITRKRHDSIPFLVTFGVVLPLTSCMPFLLMNALDIQSTVLRMGLVALPICVNLACLQAYFGFTPDVATLSLQNYRSHMGFLMIPVYDETGPKRATSQSFRQALLAHTLYYLVNAVLYSLLDPINYTPFSTSRESNEIYWSLEPTHLANNFVVAVLISLSLAFSLSGVHALVQVVGGFQCEAVVDSPMFLSTSPSDFWGRRWNRLVHHGLKNGIYKPIRQMTSSRHIATVATFLVSGLVHEYVWLVLFYKNVHQDDGYSPPFGKCMLFFGWNGILLVLEYAAARNKWIKTHVASNLPRPVVTMLVVLCALPVSHLFTGDMIQGGYFATLSLALPMIVVTKNASPHSL